MSALFFSAFSSSKDYLLNNQNDICENRLDYAVFAFLVTGIALLIIGACFQSGYIPLNSTAEVCCLAIGGAIFGLSAFVLLSRKCANACLSQISLIGSLNGGRF